MSSVEEHSEYVISTLREFGKVMIDLNVDDEEKLESLLALLEKEYIDVGKHFLKHGKES